MRLRRPAPALMKQFRPVSTPFRATSLPPVSKRAFSPWTFRFWLMTMPEPATRPAPFPRMICPPGAPSACCEANTTVPPWTSSEPKVLAPVRVSVPPPRISSPPGPVIGPDRMMLWPPVLKPPCAPSSRCRGLRMLASPRACSDPPPPSVTSPLGAPSAPPELNATTPPWTLRPFWLLTPVSVSVPSPCLVRAPSPDSAPESVKS